MRLATATLALITLAGTAHAAVPDYCAAYARDMADQWDKATPQWQLKFDNAEAACLGRYSTTAAAPAVKKKLKPPAPAAKPRPVKPAVKEKAEVAAAVSPLQEPKVVPKLVAGSPEWIDYCRKKYVSFDEVKGTYQSKTGVERKCLVTAE